MTYLDIVYNYGSLPGENELRAIDSMREVYGIRRVRFNEKDRTVRVNRRKMQGAPKKTSGRSYSLGAPRCAPLRLPFLIASRMPFVTASKHKATDLSTL